MSAYRAMGDARAALLAPLSNYGIDDPKLTIVGVWDTAGSLGISAGHAAMYNLQHHD